MKLEYRVSPAEALTILVGTTVGSLKTVRRASIHLGCKPSEQSSFHAYAPSGLRLSAEQPLAYLERLFDQVAAEVAFLTCCLAKNNRHSASPGPLGHHAFYFNSILGGHLLFSA